MNRERYNPEEVWNIEKITKKDTYIQTCVAYALQTGWIKPEQKDILINEYLIPIHQKYSEIITEVTKEMKNEQHENELLETIIRRLTHILERTQRIGSTEDNNITNAIYDYRDRFCQSDTYLEYAATSLADFISRLLASKH